MVPASLLGLLFSWTGVFVVLLSIVHVVVCLFLVAVVLLQRGRTGDVMSAFGGPTPSSHAALSTDDLLTRLTKIGAATFMFTALTLALLATRGQESVLADEPEAGAAEASAPADGSVAPDATAPDATAPEATAPEAATDATAPEALPPGDAVPPTDAAPAETVPPEGAPAPAEGAPIESAPAEPAPASAP